jgi:putative ABC transport system permease protein
MLELGPMLRALLRNKTGALLIALQIALTLTILVNALFMILDRSKTMQRPSGVDETSTFYFEHSALSPDYPIQAGLRRDLDLLRKTPGVLAATQINALPLSGYGAWMDISTQAGNEQNKLRTAVYMVDEQGVAALGLELIAGKNFSASDIQWHLEEDNRLPASIIISQSLASKLFGDWQQAPGKVIYMNKDQPLTVTAVVKTLQSAWHDWQHTEFSALIPRQRASLQSRYLVRTEPGRRDALMPLIEQQLADADRQRVIQQVRSMSQTRADAYRELQASNSILLAVILILCLVTGFGIVGLAMYSIRRRVRTIGTRRALGASQAQILRYFMLENLLISSCGALLGAFGAVGLNIWLVSAFSIPPMGPGLLLGGVLCVLLLGQLAACYPALTAARVSPAVATRGR